MATVNIQKSPKNIAILPFYGTGAIIFLVLSVLMFIVANRFQDHFFQQETLALVHTAALGWGSMVIFGAAYQLVPVIFEKELFSSNLAFISFLFLLSGTALLVWSFWHFDTGFRMIGGGILVFVAVLLYNLNIFLTAGLKNLNIQKIFLMSSALWLLTTVVIGILLAINLYYPFMQTNHLEILKLHAHIGFGGWFLQLISGVSSILVPMFLFGKSKKSQLLYAAFIFQNIGLIGYVMDHFYWGESARVYIYLVCVLVGILCWLMFLRDTFIHRVKKKIDIQMRYTFISMLCLLAAVIIILPIIITVSTNTQWSILYGIFVFLGWISGIIFGKTFKTLPFIIWNMHYKDIHGAKKIPLPKHLYKENLLLYQFWFFVSALIILSLGTVFDQLLIIQLGLLLWIVVAALYVYNVAIVFLHKKTQ